MSWIARSVSSGIVSLAVAASPLRAQCPQWSPGFHVNGVDREVWALHAVGTGPGAKLYVGGWFSNASGVPADGIAMWDGSSWSALGTGVGPHLSRVTALATYDDGTGDALYVGGSFQQAAGVGANAIARWDGTSWSPLGAGLNGNVQDLAVFDDGSGPALFAGGSFTHAGGLVVNGIAKWDGSSWSALGTGLAAEYGPFANALAVYDDGSGPALYVAGGIDSAGGVPVSNVARWDGTAWSALGAGTNSVVRTLTVYDDGDGPQLHAGGFFMLAGGAPASKVARWNGSSWSALGLGALEGTVFDLFVHDDGTGPELYAGGQFVAGSLGAKSIARWNGSDWSPLAGGTTGEVQAMTTFDDGSGARLVAGGIFGFVGGVPANRVATWDGASWSGLGDGAGVDSTVLAMTPFDDGGGPALFVAGGFTAAGDVPVNLVARWDGSSWTPLSSGMTLDAPGAVVRALAGTDGVGGPALYAGGRFSTAGGVAARNVARWDGGAWTELGSGVGDASSEVRALAVFDDGSGPALYAGGRFATAGGAPASAIARWDGSGWSQVGSGFGSSIPSWLWVEALAVYDDGSGPALYAGGAFTSAGGAPASCIARWDGVAWSEVGGGTDHVVLSLAVFDSGSGPELFAGGYFGQAGAAVVEHVARWNGTSWLSAGAGLGGASAKVTTFGVFDDGSGPALYAGGRFSHAGATEVDGIARWDGAGWSAVDGGVSDIYLSEYEVVSLAAFDDGESRGLYVGGMFRKAGSTFSNYLAEWSACEGAPLGEAFCFGDGSGAACPCANYGLPGHGCRNSSTVRGAELTAAGLSSTAIDSVVLTSAFENPGVTSIFLQGTQSIAPLPFGDGLRCTGGNLKRLYLANASAEGVVSAPTGSALPISQRSAALGDTILAGETRTYQVYYRDPSSTYCPEPAGSTFNVSQALRILWSP